MHERGDFSKSTKKTLAERVAWLCSFPGCSAITVGPGSSTSDSVTNLGEAAHIHAAAAGGPRYDPNMTQGQRRSIENGIWMCRRHARLIDADSLEYAAETITQWKQLAEKTAYERLSLPGQDRVEAPTTLIQMGKDLVFAGYWKRAEATSWVFEVACYLYGDEIHLKDYCSDFSRSKEWNRFVVVESQGDGRLITTGPSWTAEDGRTQVTVTVGDKQPSIDPNKLGGTWAFDMEIGDSVVENGRIKVVAGLQNAIQRLSHLLSSEYRKTIWGYEFGSLFGTYYRDYNDREPVLERLLKLEVSRLATIPIIGDPHGQTSPLCFVKRVHNVRIEESCPVDSKIHVSLRLEWGNGDLWSGRVCVCVEPRA